MIGYWLLPLVLLGLAEVPLATSDPQPTRVGAPRASFLAKGCHLEVTAGADWNRLWLNCGAGPHLLSEPSSLTWHVRIRTSEEALELVRLFSSRPGACARMPTAPWIEVTPADRAGWLTLDRATYARVCPEPSAEERTEAGVPARRFVVTRCLFAQHDGHLYRVEQRVKENGETETIRETVVLPDARRLIGSCDPAAPLDGY